MEELKSKSQKKREAAQLQKIGVELVALSLDKLNELPLDPQLRRAIVDAKSLKSHGAIRRQAQLIGKLMRASNIDEILPALETMQAEGSAITANFHATEIWRERLIKGGKDALTEFVDTFKPEDVQQLRVLIKKAVDEQVKGEHTAAKILFRYIRAILA